MRRKKKADKNNANNQTITDISKTMLHYMQKLTNAITTLDSEMKYLTTRIEELESRSSLSSSTHRPVKPPIELPVLPNIGVKKKKKKKQSISSNMNHLPPDDLQLELRSVLDQGPKLKTVDEAKKEHYKEIQTAVHDEYKKIGVKSRNKGSNNLASKSESELKNELARDLEKEFERIKKKLNR